MSTTPRPDYVQFVAKQKGINDMKASSVRCVPLWGFHALCPPIASLVYCAKTNYWMPAIAATASFCVTLPLDMAGLLVTSTFVPPIVSAGMITSRVKRSRRDLGIVMPEEADAMLYDNRIA